MNKISLKKIILISVSIVLLALFLSACGSEEPPQRLPSRYVFNPGAVFATNINHDDPRRVLRCAVMLEVIDEQASIELVSFDDTIRNAILVVLGELTMAEVTTDKNLDAIAARIVAQVNEALGGHIPLVVGASFTEFVLT